MKVLITVKTYPIPSKKYDELVCTAGVTETGDFIRLYPINFRDLDCAKKYRKYQWIEVSAVKHIGRDVRKESYRPDSDSIRILGEPLSTDGGTWAERAKYVMQKKTRSIEELSDLQQKDRTSLGIFKPKKVNGLVISPCNPEWSPKFLNALNQQRLFEYRQKTLSPPRKVPFKFQYQFECDDPRCNGNHRMMIEDWEVGALFWKMVDAGDSHEEASRKVRDKFLNDLCGPDKDIHFYVGTLLAHPTTWVVIGVFYPKKQAHDSVQTTGPTLFDNK
ncbi:MAG TPA: hypothetical protein PL033_19675 [Candidatus Brocadiia bacterium]|nr:hypothetical protein [Candidatus Brocadiia bacterium]